MKHFWRKFLLLSLLMLPWQASANQPDVLSAAKSVYRLWIGVPLPTQIASQLVSPQMLSEINSNGYVRVAAQNGQNLTLFKQNSQIYLFVWGGGYFCTGMTGGKKRRKTLSGADLSEAGARKNLHQLLL